MKKLICVLSFFVSISVLSTKAKSEGFQKVWKTPLGKFRLVSNFGFCSPKVHKTIPKSVSKDNQIASKKYRVPFMLVRCDMQCTPSGCFRLPTSVKFSVKVKGKKVFMHIRHGKKHVVIEYLKGGKLRDVTPKRSTPTTIR